MVGAGIIGLGIATRLAEAGVRVRVWAKTLSPDTTSDVAAALWYPYKAERSERVVQWSAETYHALVRLAVERPDLATVREGIEVDPEGDEDPWWTPLVQGERLPWPEVPAGRRAALRFRAPVVEPSPTLAWMRTRLEAAAGVLERHPLDSLAPACAEAAVVVNASGLGARELAGDATLAGLRGHVVRVRAPGVTRVWLDDHHPEGTVYVVPRRDDVICGGTRAAEGDETPDPATTRAILARCTASVPGLAGCEVLGARVGHRPYRPDVRLQVESRHGARVLHAYGHGGAGWTMGWGFADEAAALARTLL